MSPSHSPRSATTAAAEVVAYALYGLGYRPREQLVVVDAQLESAAGRACGPGQTRQRVSFGMIASFAHPRFSGGLTEIRDLACVLERSGARQVYVILIGEGCHERTHRAAAARVADALRSEGIGVLDVIGVGASHFRSLLCDDVACGDSQPRALAEVFATQVAATMVLQGRGLALSEDQVIADVAPQTDPALAEAVRRRKPLPATPGRRSVAVRSWFALLAGADGVAGSGGSAGSGSSARSTATVESQAARGSDVPLAHYQPLSPQAAGRWVIALEDLVFRDCVLIALLAPDTERALAQALRLSSGDLAAAGDALDQGVPDGPLAAAGIARLSDLARRAPSGRRAAALSLLSWMAWWQGDGVRARLLCEAAILDQPGYSLAELLQTMLASAVPPPWMSERLHAAG